MQEKNQELRENNQRLQDRVVVLELRAVEHDAKDVQRDAKDAGRDQQIALLMARLNLLLPQQPVLLVPHNEPAPVLLPAPPPSTLGRVQAIPPTPPPVAIQTLHQASPIVRPKLRPAPGIILPAPAMAPAQMALAPAPLPPPVQIDDYKLPPAPGAEVGIPQPVRTPTSLVGGTQTLPPTPRPVAIQAPHQASPITRPKLLPAPQPVDGVQGLAAIPLPVAIPAPNPEPAIPEPGYELLPAPGIDRPPPPPVVDDAQVLATVNRWCIALEEYLKDNALMPLREVEMPRGIVVDREEVAYQAFNRIEKALEKLIDFQERICRNNSRYKEPLKIALVRRNILNLVPLSDRLLNHLEVMIAAIKITGWAFEKAGPEVKNKREAALIAICRTPGAFAAASLELRDDIDLARFAFFGELTNTDLYQIEALRFSPHKNQKSWLYSPSKNTGLSLQHVGDQVRANKPFVIQVVQKNPLDVMHAGELHKNNDADKKIARTAVQGNGYALRFVPTFQDDLDVVVDALTTATEAARANGDDRAFEFISAQLKNHPDVLAIVTRREKSGCVIS